MCPAAQQWRQHCDCSSIMTYLRRRCLLAQAKTTLSTTALLSTHSTHAETKYACVLILEMRLFSSIIAAYYCYYSVLSHRIYTFMAVTYTRYMAGKERMLSQRKMQSGAYTHDDICVSMQACFAALVNSAAQQRSIHLTSSLSSSPEPPDLPPFLP